MRTSASFRSNETQDQARLRQARKWQLVQAHWRKSTSPLTGAVDCSALLDRFVTRSDYPLGTMKTNQHGFVMTPAARAIFHREASGTDHRCKNQRAKKKMARPE